MDKIQSLVDLSIKHNFLIFEDRKFADIGNTVKSQYEGGIYKISKWSNFINAHSIAGSGCIQGLREVASECIEPKGCILIAQLSSKNNLIDQNYTNSDMSFILFYFKFDEIYRNRSIGRRKFRFCFWIYLSKKIDG